MSMSKRRKKIDSRQISIYDAIRSAAAERGSAATPATPPYRIASKLRAAIVKAIKGSPHSRHEIADRMSAKTGDRISKALIDSWTRESNPRHVPAEWLPALCDVCGDAGPLRVMGELVGLFVMEGPAALQSEVAQLQMQRRKINREIRKRERLVAQMVENAG